MLFILLTIIIVTLVTYFYLKPLIDNLFYSVPYEPKYIHSFIPLFGFGLQMFKDPIGFTRSLYLKYGQTFVIYLTTKRWVYFYDEQTFLTKVLKSSDVSMDGFLFDVSVYGLNISHQCTTNEEIQQIILKQYHQYLVGDELEILNKRVHDSFIDSMKLDAQTMQRNQTKTVYMFDHFGEFILYATTEGLFGYSFVTEQRNITPNFYKLFQDFDQAFKLGILRVPFRSILYKSIFQYRLEFVQRFSSLKLNNGESKLIHEREELFHSDQFKSIVSEYDRAALQAGILWAAAVNTSAMNFWSLVDLLLHPKALEAVQQELKENIPSSSSLYDKNTLAKLKILESCINESIRRVFNSVSIREAITNTTIECLDRTKVGLRKGDVLVYPAFLKHFDPNLFGLNPYEYQYDRFVKKSNEPKAPSTMFFGCGIHMCPGRFWAINEIKIFIALIIQHMNIEFVNMTEQDKDEYRKRLPYDYTKFISSSGPKRGYEHKFHMKYSYKNLHIE